MPLKKLSAEENIVKAEERLLKHLAGMRSDFLHPYIGIKLRAYQNTLDFIEQEMPDAIVCNNRKEVFNYALKHLTLDGIVAEFGVKSGTTLKELANKPALRKKQLYGFDSFTGIPDDWCGTKTLKGQLSNSGKIPKMPKNIKLIPGWFADSLPIFVKEYKEPASLLHIDCDIYKSTQDIFRAFAKKIVPGTVIIFDEFFNYPNWQQHEYKAWQEFVAKHKIKFKYLCYAHTQVAVKVI